ncbi:MAG: head GIN domain-containing protein [Bacteroidota bacterium]
MKPQILPIAGILFLLFSLSSSCNRDATCTKGQGNLVTQTIDLPDFAGLRILTAADVVLTQGEVQRVAITAQQNVIDLLKRTVDGNIWPIEFEGCFETSEPITIEITLPTLTYAAIEGSGNLTGTNRFTDLNRVELAIEGSGDLTLNLEAIAADTRASGSGDLDLNLTANTLNFRNSGSGDQRFTGSAPEFIYSNAGSGSCSAFGLAADNIAVANTGSGDCRVTANQNLNVNLGGSGDVYYRGRPAIELIDNGSGELIDAN